MTGLVWTIPPDNSSYTVAEQSSAFIRVQTEGGPSRKRRDIVGTNMLVTCQWNFNPTQYDYFQAFYRQAVKSGTRFTMSLIIKYDSIQPYQCFFIPQTVQTATIDGQTYTVTVQLEVVDWDDASGSDLVASNGNLLMPPDSSAYTVAEDIPEGISVLNSGGSSFYRKAIPGGPKNVNCTWLLTNAEYNIFCSFYRYFTTAGCGLPFLIDLIVGESGLTRHNAWFVPTTFNLSGQQGNLYTVTAQLEVAPVAYTDDYDNAVISMNQLGDLNVLNMVINQLAYLINTKFPATLK